VGTCGGAERGELKAEIAPAYTEKPQWDALQELTERTERTIGVTKRIGNPLSAWVKCPGWGQPAKSSYSEPSSPQSGDWQPRG